MRCIPLTKNKVTLVSDEDYERVCEHSWCAACVKGMWYAQSSIGGKRVGMHNFIMTTGTGMEVDHIDGQCLNNTRTNLRVVSHSTNCRNRGPNKNCTSKYKGVHWYGRIGKWSARIKDKGRTFFLGNFTDEIDAALAYNAKAKELGRLPHSYNSELEALCIS